MNANYLKNPHRKYRTGNHVKQCAHCNANYRSARITSKYCCSSCRARAWQQRQDEQYGIMEQYAVSNKLAPARQGLVRVDAQVAFFVKFYSQLSELNQGDKQKMGKEAEAYLLELEEGKQTTEGIQNELTIRMRYNISKEDYRVICHKKYGTAPVNQAQIVYSDVIQYLTR